MRIKKKFNKDIAKAISLATPALAKNKTVLKSLKPKPPKEIGSSVIAPIMGIKTKK